MLTQHLLPAMRRISGDMFIFHQQDSVPAHRARERLRCLVTLRTSSDQRYGRLTHRTWMNPVIVKLNNTLFTYQLQNMEHVPSWSSADRRCSVDLEVRNVMNNELTTMQTSSNDEWRGIGHTLSPRLYSNVLLLNTPWKGQVVRVALCHATCIYSS